MSNNQAQIKRTSEKYYVLTRPDGSEIGGSSKQALERYAKSFGWIVSHSDSRPSVMRVEHGL